MLKKKIWIIVLIFLSGGKAMAENQNGIELNSVMMRNTYKIKGNNSMGTCFLIGKPLEKNPKRARYILVTAAHVLEQMKSDEATVYLRRKKSDNLFVKIPWKIEIRKNNKALWGKNK